MTNSELFVQTSAAYIEKSDSGVTLYGRDYGSGGSTTTSARRFY